MNELYKMKKLEKQIIGSTVFKMKRVLDVILSSVMLILCLPIFPFIALAVRLESSGPILFTQMRIGACMPTKTHIFNMIKFRTMYCDAEQKSGAVWASKGDPRITKVGLFLRKTRLDELPQLINVLKGDMSLVGPRPERPGFYQRLETAIPYFSERTYGVLPGITGLAQVNQGYDTCIEDVRSKLGFDLSYSLSLENMYSWIKMDINICWKTFVVMVAGRGQ